ncbi:DinB family protein [Stackebrandtia soli]|uniref:DinB family protein n=1 Tax=Stackebrandtia soli TaxID=1892856 RepID=UPI0039E8A181
MTESQQKAELHQYLRSAREALLWKLDGLSEYDIRRPLTPTGTQLLGLVKHMTSVESGYFGLTFGRPFPEDVDFLELDIPHDMDLWATANESREYIVDLYRRVAEHADATIEALPLDAPGEVPWWNPKKVTLHRILVHVVAEINRHAGHADIVREEIDGSAGLRPGNDNLVSTDETWLRDYHARLEAIARSFKD